MTKLDSLKALNNPVTVLLPTGRATDIFSISHAVVFKVVGRHWLCPREKMFLSCTFKQRFLYMKEKPSGSAICLNYVWRIHIKRLTACSLHNSLWCVRSPDSSVFLLSHLPSANKSLQSSISSANCCCWKMCGTEQLQLDWYLLTGVTQI